MKKMSIVDKKEFKHTFFGLSNRRGIYMRLETEEKDEQMGCYSASQFPGAYACISEDGKIKVDPENVNDIIENIKEKDNEDSKKVNRMKNIFQIASIIFMILMLPMGFLHRYFVCLFAGLALICMGLGNIPCILYAVIRRIMGDKEYKQWARFHAAEHAAINAYYDLKRTPNMEEIKEYSIYSYRCGIAREMKKAWPCIGMGICRLIPGAWCFPFLVIFLIFSVWAYKKSLFFTEVVWLAEPTEFEYDAAIRVMKKAIEEKESVERSLQEELEMISDFKKITVMLKISEDGPRFDIYLGDSEDLEDE